MPEQAICEYCHWGEHPTKVDRQGGVLWGVKVLGLLSRNRRQYQEDALRRAVPLYEGAKVNINHPPQDPTQPRDYRDRLGFLRNVHYRPAEGLFADLHFNPKHELAERLVWDAQHAPQNVGLSHNVLAQVESQGEISVVTEIHRVVSVDLVADPATTNGLFESQTPSPSPEAESAGGSGDFSPWRDSGTVGSSPEAERAGGSGDRSASVPEKTLPEKTPPGETRCPTLPVTEGQLREAEVRRLRRELSLRQELEAGPIKPPGGKTTPDEPVIGSLLWETLLAETDDARSRRLLAELKELVRAAQQCHRLRQPFSRDPLADRGCQDAVAFVRAITHPG